MKEKLNKRLIVVVQKSFYDEFKKTCENEYKTVSEVIRDFMFNRIRDYNKKCQEWRFKNL